MKNERPPRRYKGTVLTSVTKAGEVMVTMPGGRVVFMGFWEALRFVCVALFNGYEVRAEDE